MSTEPTDRSEPVPVPLRPHNRRWPVDTALPLSPTPFVGRERERALLRGLLSRADVRLVTLTGPGGVGKTRLALQVAGAMGGDFAGGVVFVSLAPVRDPALVAAAIAAALDVRETRDRAIAEMLRAHLSGRETLLVLDNCEHLVEAAPLVAELLASCPGLTALATSRALLRLYGEHDVPVPTLPLPDLGRLPPPTVLASNDAVRLFVERAQSARADFALTADNAAAVVAICHRLDGLPLAIELAAAWSKILPPAALLTRLDRRLPLLVGGPQDQPARLRTLRDAVAWSHDLLSEAQRELFRRLAVFVGGFTPAAAEAVAGVPGEPAGDLLAGPTSLVHASLVHAVEGPGGEPRFGMLETIREFGLERLEMSGEAEATRARHAAYFLALADDLAAHLEGGQLVAALDRLSADIPNVRAALAWALEREENETALRLAAALYPFWRDRVHLSEGRRWLDAALAKPRTAPTTRADALFAAAMLAALQGDHRRSAALAEEGRAVGREHDYPFGVGRALMALGASAEWQGEADRASSLLADGLALMRELGATPWIARLATLLADVTYERGDLERATALAEEGLTLARAAGHTWCEALALGVLANVAYQQSRYATALRHYAEALALYQVLGDQRGVAGMIAALAGVASAAGGSPEGAARLLGAARGLADSVGVAHLTHFIHAERVTAAVRARLTEEAYEAAWEAGHALRPDQAVAEALASAHAAVDAAPSPAAPAAAGYQGLTPREREVLRLLVQGRMDREIAAALSISPRTASNHVLNILAKLGVETRTAAATHAVRHGLV